MNPAPPQPPAKNADRKAILAYHSELRRWATALARWEADLDRRETEFEDAMSDEMGIQNDGSLMDDYDPDPDTEECDCTGDEADSGCDCPACERFRSERAKKLIKRQQEAVKIGDEIQWLEELWNLPDKRRKKK